MKEKLKKLSNPEYLGIAGMEEPQKGPQEEAVAPPTTTPTPAPSSSSPGDPQPQPSSSSSTNGNVTDKEALLKKAHNYMIHGKRHLLVKDISSAVASLGESCQLFSEANGPLCPENAESHFCYGKALLEQSRLEQQVFNDGTSGAIESESSEMEEDEEDEEEDGDDEEEEEEEEEGESGEKAKEKENEVEDDGGEAENAEADADEDEEKKEEDLSVPSPVETAVDNKAPTPAAGPEAQTVTVTATENNENQEPGPSKQITATADNANGKGEKEKEGEEELSSLELAWEVFEIAKIGYSSQLQAVEKQLQDMPEGDEEKKNQASKTKLHLQKRLAETYSLLGEVATESENYGQAIEEFKAGIEVMEKVGGPDCRHVAQYYFQMGLAYSFWKKFQESIDSFKKSKSIIELRISNLKSKIESKQTNRDLGIEYEDPAVTEVEEVAEMEAVLPELDEKVADTIDAERESKASLEEQIQEEEIALRNSPVKNPNPPVVNDISHLVKKKKKAEASPEQQNPAKRICFPESSAAVSSSNGSSTEIVTANGHEKGAPVKEV